MIYFARCGNDGPIKIGHTIGGLTSRISYLQVGCPWQINVLGTMEGDMISEIALLKNFSHLNMRGEWFHASDELLDFIQHNAVPFEKASPKHNSIYRLSEAISNDEDWSSVIREVMALKNWRQVDMAEALGIHQALISKWVNGRHGPNRETRSILRSLLLSAQKGMAA